MTIVDIMVREYKTDLENEIDLEINDQEYLKSEDYPDSLTRSTAGNQNAIQRSNKIGALKDAYHQRDEHGKDREGEIGYLESELGVELTKEVQETEDYWNP